MTPPRPSIGVGAVVLDSAGHVLIGHRTKAGEPPTWCLPGGHVEAGETFEDAASREVLEEAGVVVAQPRAFAIATKTIGSGLTAGVAARAEQNVAHLREPEVFSEWVWAPPNDLPEPLYPASRMLLEVWRGSPGVAGWSIYHIAGVR